MKSLRCLRSPSVCLSILRAAALLVPALQREEWLAEWRAELWHVRSADITPQSNERSFIFCLGAFKDGYWIRRERCVSSLQRTFRIGSPTRCISFLAIMAALSFMLACYLPEARKAILPTSYPNAQNLALLSDLGQAWTSSPTVQLGQYQTWKTTSHNVFTRLSFYQLIHKKL